MFVCADYRLNPVLRKACKADIPKFCQPILTKAMADSELEGQVISCLKLKYADQVSLRRVAACPEHSRRRKAKQQRSSLVCQLQRLSTDCEDQIRIILQEAALDYRLDPQLHMHCTQEVRTFTQLPTGSSPLPGGPCHVTCVFVCVSDFAALCRGGSRPGADGAGGGVSEGEPAEAQTGRM